MSKSKINKSSQAREKRQKSWQQCLEARSKRSDEEQLEKLDREGHRALKERKRLEYKKRFKDFLLKKN